MAFLFIPPPVDYTALDFDSLRDRLLRLAQSAFPDLDLLDLAELTTMLLEANAHIGDVIAFYLRKTGREAHWTTATQRRSMLSMVKLIGYKAPGATAATAVESFTLAAPMAGSVTLPAGTTVRTKQVTAPVVYQLLADLVFQPGSTTASATVENSASADEGFTSTGIAFQRFTLANTPYLDGSATPVAANGTYVEVPNFLKSEPTDLHFVTVVDQNDKCTITFGNGINGAIPVGDIAVVYKTGGGSAGRVIAGALSSIDGSFIDSLGTTVGVSVTNPDKSDGGNDRASVEQIRELAPESLRVLERAVAREDFELGAKQVSGVARALALGYDEDPSVGLNTINLFVVTEDGSDASPTLLADVRAQFEIVAGHAEPPLKKVNSLRLNIFSGLFLTVDVLAAVYLRKGANRATAGAAIRTNLASFFAIRQLNGALNDQIDFGYYIQDVDGDPTGSLAFSDIYDTVRDSAGVLKISDGATDFTLNGTRLDVPIQLKQFPKLGQVVLVDALTGTAF